MSVIRIIDEYILNRVQAVSDGIHSLTGLDCLQQSRSVGVVVALSWLLQIVYQEAAWHSFDWLAAVLLLARVTRIFFESDMDVAARSNARTGARNPRRVHPMDILNRVTLLPILPIVPFSRWQIGLALVSSWLCYLLEACDVQTPTPGKIREALREIGFRMFGMKPVTTE